MEQFQHLMRDSQTADDVDAILESLRRTSNELALTARDVRSITGEIRHGDGTANALVYGEEGREAIENIGQVSFELAHLLRDIREGDGTLHDLVYEDEGDALLANLTQISDDIAHITGEMRAGRGTVGGFLIDPSIYEDVKRLVGDLERNEILRALVRYSIRRDEVEEQVEVREQ